MSCWYCTSQSCGESEGSRWDPQTGLLPCCFQAPSRGKPTLPLNTYLASDSPSTPTPHQPQTVPLLGWCCPPWRSADLVQVGEDE